jgi:hypothetical protein
LYNGDVDESNLSDEARLSRKHPGLKDAVCSLPEFQEWVQSLPTVVVDDFKYFLRGGDMLKDHDQVVWEWARKNRPDLLPPDED